MTQNQPPIEQDDEEVVYTIIDLATNEQAEGTDDYDTHEQAVEARDIQNRMHFPHREFGIQVWRM